MPEPIEYEWMIQRVQRCEAQIWSTAAAVLATGTSVILDIGLMRKADREEGIFEVPDPAEIEGAIVSESA